MLEECFTAWLYRPYLDLGPLVSDGPFHTFGVEFAFRTLDEDVAYPRIQSVLMPSFRDALIRDTALSAYGVSDPLRLPAELGTDRWWRFCSWLSGFHDLPRRRQIEAVRLLAKLCFYDQIHAFAGDVTDGAIAASEDEAAAAYFRALADYVVAIDNKRSVSLGGFQRVAELAPRGTVTRINALYQMSVQNVKHLGDGEAAEYWISQQFEEIKIARPSLDVFTWLQLQSRANRVAGFVPQLRGDYASMTEFMDDAQRYAEEMPRDTVFRRIGADEMLYPVLESRIKEALRIGDLDLAGARAQQLVELRPVEPRARLHLGQVLIEQYKIEEALETYRAATRYGPPGNEIAWFMLGQCHEALEDPQAAISAYLQSLRYDAFAVSALERLGELTSRLGLASIASWVSERMESVVRGAASSPTGNELSEFQKYTGILGE